MSKTLVFIPAYNCRNQIGRVLAQFTPEVCKDIDTILVINNRSTDDTEQAAIDAAAKVRGAGVKVLRNDENYGLGGSQKIGFGYAVEHGFDHVVILHGDDQGDIQDLLRHLRQAGGRDADALLGARFMPGSSVPGYSRFRTFGNHVFNLLFSLVCGKRLHDLGAGLNMYKVSSLKDGYYRRFPDNLTFNYAMVLAHCHRRDTVRFFPLTWREEDQVSNVKIVRQAMEVLGMLGKYFIRRGGFLASDMRAVPRDSYTYVVVHEQEQR